MTGFLTGGVLGMFGGTAATTATTSNIGWISTNSSATTMTGYTAWNQQTHLQQQVLYQQAALGQQQSESPWFTRRLITGEYELPDGSKLIIDARGNYKILDEEAKVMYLACRVREFNPYINASDLLEAFIKEVGLLDEVDQGDVLRLPIEAFINWIILQAARRDGDPLDDLPSVESALVRALPSAA